MATLGSQGLVDDGSANLTVGGVTTANVMVSTINTVTGSNFCVIPSAGFFQIPVTGSAGQGSFTGSLPSAAAFPGSKLFLTDTVGTYPWLLTGSMSMLAPSSSLGVGGFVAVQSSSFGTKMTMSQGGSIGFWSDSKGWLVCAVSGTAVLRP